MRHDMILLIPKSEKQISLNICTTK